jgi:uncharacterized protein YbbK (DUF523 family)
VQVDGKPVRNKRGVADAVASAITSTLKIVVATAVGQEEFILERNTPGCGIDVSDSGASANCRGGGVAEVT